ncbi:hypothetical protein L7F22_055716 [Adiantum nelumboides]|nr:hypothetical protein [Adiantum nelumboides]
MTTQLIACHEFLADLEDLSDNEALQVETQAGSGLKDAEMADFNHVQELINVPSDDIDAVAKLQQSPRFRDIMHKVAQAPPASLEARQPQLDIDNDPDHQLLVDCNTLSANIENEIISIHNFIRDRYRSKFPELESLVLHPIDYARVVRKIGNEMDLTLVDLEGLLPSAIILAVSITASTSIGKPLSEENLQKTLKACDRALALDGAIEKVLDFVESRMAFIAPNLSAVVGTTVAAKLLGAAGSLDVLSKMPSCNVQTLGAKKKTLAGFSTAASSTSLHIGFVSQAEVVQSTPPALRTRCCRLVAGKAALAARIDLMMMGRGDLTGKSGRDMREEIRKKLEKWQEPPPPRQAKPLPVPDLNPKKKRGGRRLRKMKERYAMTEVRKLANRMQFGVAEESSLGDGLGHGYGMLGQAGSGKLRVIKNLGGKAAKKLSNRSGSHAAGSSSYGSRSRSGLLSSFAFTPLQGIELANPEGYAAAHFMGSGTQSTYFSEIGTFASKIEHTILNKI